MKQYQQRGFTIVELSIVLVIVALLIGGVLVANNMIQASKVNRQAQQITQYKTASNSFRDKYNGMAGDLLASTANGFVMTARTGAAGHGDGNARLEGCSASSMLAGCETVLYWNDLTFAGLLAPSLNSATDALLTATATTRDVYFPMGALNGTYVTTFSVGATNFFQLAGIESTAAGVYTLSNQITPLQAYSLDIKLDDGIPLQGSVRAVGGTGPLNVAAVPGASNCVATTTDNPYNTITTDLGEGLLCQLAIRMD